uniref:Protein kinase domain-containing protein n=1 Tax=Amphimedon queenslandica TaxID=400682 RepID=A0A1X7UZ70_AMPQE
MTERILERGGWGEVRVASFHGLEVAAKVLHETIISEYNVSLFSREMNIASKIRHPNLLQFIGATTEGNPMILTELMPTSLRKELESGGVAYPAILSISLDTINQWRRKNTLLYGTGRWEQKPTTGNPPLGVMGYAAAAIGREIFYFGGWCYQGDCYHNSLYSFNVDTFNWKELSPTTSHHGPMMKSLCDMIAIKVNGEDYLVVIGGKGPSSNNTPPQPGAQYSGRVQQRCNEIHFYKLSTGQWISPTVTGHRLPPIDGFTLTSINNSSAILFGGITDNGVSNNVYILNFPDTSVNCSKLSNPGGSVQWPKGRNAHSSVLINTSSGPHLLVVGGYGAYDLWIFDINNKSWKKLDNLPDNFTRRWFHSLSVGSVTPTTNWIIVFGGSSSYSDTAVIEFRYTSNNDWSTSIILLDQYQEKLQERRREWEASQPVQPEDRREIDRLIRVLQERERELEEERREKEQVRNRLQQQLQGREQQLQQAQQQGQEREREIQQAREQVQDLQRQLQERERQLHQAEQQLQSREREAQEREQQLQRQVEGGQQREQDLQRQLQQAQQQLRERDRQERESSWVPHPILHRDVSSANVLLQPMIGVWRAKVSDYGSANLQHSIIRSVNPGGPLYAAPEAANPREHSPSMDVFSYGVLLLEMITQRIPLPEERVGLIDVLKQSFKYDVIIRALPPNKMAAKAAPDYQPVERSGHSTVRTTSKNMRAHKPKAVLGLNLKGVSLYDERSKSITRVPVDKVTYVTHDPEDQCYFGVIIQTKESHTGFRLYCFKAKRPIAVTFVNSSLELFDLIMKLRQAKKKMKEEKEEADKAPQDSNFSQPLLPTNTGGAGPPGGGQPPQGAGAGGKIDAFSDLVSIARDKTTSKPEPAPPTIFQAPPTNTETPPPLPYRPPDLDFTDAPPTTSGPAPSGFDNTFGALPPAPGTGGGFGGGMDMFGDSFTSGGGGAAPPPSGADSWMSFN